jgi:hypothetical protein
MTGPKFQRLAELRIGDSGILLQNNRWEGAYYLAGYAVECALKACICKAIPGNKFPDRETEPKLYSHDIVTI